MGRAVVTVQDGSVAAHTVLGQGAPRIPTGGKIRAGIKVLTRKAASESKAKAIYEQGLAAGQSFEQIERAITEALPALKTPLVPRNVQWFTVRGQDFSNPEIARQILSSYGEDRGDGLRLYRFPVVFPSDAWRTVMPHELAVWGAHEKRFWCEYSPDGRVRYCMRHAPVPVDDTGRRTIRIFGGRKVIRREENGGICEPEVCPEYQQRQCNLTGRFVFFIPGIRSLAAFELHTNSFYAMNAAIQKFETIAFMRGGRISGFLDRARTPFFLTKRLMEVAHIDEQGRPVRVPQWIIELEAPVDVTALLRDNEDAGTALVQATLASQLLQGDEAIDEVASPDEVSDQDAPIEPPATRTGNASRDGPPSLDDVMACVQAYGIEDERYTRYADLRWGAGWKLNAYGRRRAREELDRYRNDPQGYADKIGCELQRVPQGRAA